MPRTFAPSKKDATQPEVERLFKAAGWSVCDVHAVGKKAPDLFVAKHNITFAIECKSMGRKRKPHQREWESYWRGEYLWGDDPEHLLAMAENRLKDFMA